jgi:hypothetical protein
MPFFVLIIEKDPIVRLGLEQFFKEQFSEEGDQVITVNEAAELDIAHLEENEDFDLFDFIVYRIPAFPQDEARSALINRSLFRALYYKKTYDSLENHMFSCHSGDVAVEVDEPDWGMQLAKRAKEFLCSRFVDGGLDALFIKRSYQYPASPYEGRFRRLFVGGRGLTFALAELQTVIMEYWDFLDDRTRGRVREQFHVDFDHEIGGQKYPVFVSLR